MSVWHVTETVQNDRPQQSFLGAFAINMRILGALMLRDASSRYGHENLGFFWVMGEPLILTAGVMAMWTMTGQGHGHGVGVVPFALSGYSLLTLWRHIVFSSVHGVRRNIGLLFHRNIRAFDILFARTILEMAGVLTAFFIAYLPLMLFDALKPMSDPLVLIGAWVLMTWFSFAFGLVLAGITELSEAAERFVNPVMYLTLPITGAFFMVSWLPDSFRRVVIWSPLVNAQEMFRCGLFPPDIPTEWNGWYLTLWCIVLTAIGLSILRKAQNHVRME